MARYQDTSLLEAALVGYQVDLARIKTTIADLQRRVGTRTRISAPEPLSNSPAPKKQHIISPEGRARIAEAQRKRWAAAKKAK